MMKHEDKDPIDILGAIYEGLYEKAEKEARELEEVSEPALHRIVEKAKEKLEKIEGATREDIDKVAEWVKRDLHDAAHYLSETGKDLKDWLGFETALVESSVLYRLFSAADPTTLELLKLKEQAEMAEWHTGEITGPGTLVCDNCGERLHFYKVSRIPPCPKCHGTVFHRAHD